MAITQKDTKATIFAAYRELLAENRRLRSQAGGAPAPAAATRSRGAKGGDIGGVVSGLEGLRSSFGESAGALQGKLTTEAERLEELQTQVAAHTAHLMELHQIEPTEATLSELVHRYDAVADAFSEEMADKEASLESELTQMRSEWSKEQALHRLRVAERDRQVQMSRQRDEAEYSYALQHRRALDADAYAQEQSQLQAALDQLQLDHDCAFAEREDDLAEREDAFAELAERVALFDEELATAVRSATEEGAAIARKQAKNAADLLAQENEGTLAVNQLKITALTDTLHKQAAEISELSAKLSAAQTRAQELAVKAIEGASNETSFVAIKEIALEQAKATQPKR